MNLKTPLDREHAPGKLKTPTLENQFTSLEFLIHFCGLSLICFQVSVLPTINTLIHILIFQGHDARFCILLLLSSSHTAAAPRMTALFAFQLVEVACEISFHGIKEGLTAVHTPLQQSIFLQCQKQPLLFLWETGFVSFYFLLDSDRVSV